MKSAARMELKPGMVLGEDVTVNGNTILKSGDKITNHSIELMTRFGVMCVTILEEVDFAKSHFEKLRFSEEFKAFELMHQSCVCRYKTEIETFFANASAPPTHTLLSLYDDMRKQYKTSSQLLDYIHNLMPNADQLTYNHCLNSALLGGLFAEWLHMSEQEKEILILSCFYYDIGKLKLPYQLLWKSGKLTDAEFELVQKHTLIGYALLNQYNTIHPHIKNAVIMHHERMDGSGYPYHLGGDKIDMFARYISIIDTYIAMASPRSYRDAFTPLQIVAHFEDNMDSYDSSLVIPLLTHIADSQIGMHIQLSDDSVWEVMLIHPARLSQPVLKNDMGDILYLSERPDLKILRNL